MLTGNPWEQKVEHQRGGRRHQCRLCNFCTNSSIIFTRHCKFHMDNDLAAQPAVDGDESQLKCKTPTYQNCPRTDKEACPETFRRKGQKNVYLQTVHSKERRFKCSTCGSTFLHRCHLERHLRTHTGERPHTCEVCCKTFVQRSHLAVHLEAVHVAERKWKCSICGSGFVRKDHLRSHERTHSGERAYRCEVCTKMFSQRSSLVAHLRTFHAGERE